MDSKQDPPVIRYWLQTYSRYILRDSSHSSSIFRMACKSSFENRTQLLKRRLESIAMLGGGVSSQLKVVRSQADYWSKG